MHSNLKENINILKKTGIISNREIARRLNINESTVRRYLNKTKKNSSLYQFPSTIVDHIELDNPISHIGEIMITADWHFPLFSPAIANSMLTEAKNNSIRVLAIGGDLFNMDALSRYEPKQSSAELEEEIKIAKRAMEILLENFDHIYCIKGNHDERLVKSLGYKIQFEQSMHLIFGSLGDYLLDRIIFSNLDYMWIKPYKNAASEQSWYLCHPESYTQVALSKSRLLADKHNTNVITAHSHHFALGWARDGKKIVAEAGGLFDSNKTEYLQRSTNYPEWVNGYMWLEYNQDKTLLGINCPSSLWFPRND